MRPTIDDAELLQFIVKIKKNNLLQYIGPEITMISSLTIIVVSL